MARDIGSGGAAEIEKGRIYPILLIEIETYNPALAEVQPVRAWTGAGLLVFQGHDFTGVGTFGSIGTVEESADQIRSNSLVLGLSGIPSDLLSVVLANEYKNRPAKLWLQFLDSTGTLIVPVLPALWRGFVDKMEIDEGPETSRVIVTCESRYADLRRPKIRRWTSEDQQELYPGNLGLEFVSSIQNAEIKWAG